MGWEGLPDIDVVAPIDDVDLAVLDEIREVLQRRGAINRFGIAVLHSHFDVDPDEVLVETVDRSTRTLTTQPMKTAEMAGSLSPTLLRLTSSGEAIVVAQYCHRPPGSVVHAC